MNFGSHEWRICSALNLFILLDLGENCFLYGQIDNLDTAFDLAAGCSKVLLLQRCRFGFVVSLSLPVWTDLAGSVAKLEGSQALRPRQRASRASASIQKLSPNAGLLVNGRAKGDQFEPGRPARVKDAIEAVSSGQIE